MLINKRLKDTENINNNRFRRPGKKNNRKADRKNHINVHGYNIKEYKRFR